MSQREQLMPGLLARVDMVGMGYVRGCRDMHSRISFAAAGAVAACLRSAALLWAGLV